MIHPIIKNLRKSAVSMILPKRMIQLIIKNITKYVALPLPLNLLLIYG